MGRVRLQVGRVRLQVGRVRLQVVGRGARGRKG